MRRLESLKRVCVLWLSLAGLLLETAVYAYIWFRNYYPIVNRFNLGLKFFFKGHLLIIAIYFVLLFFFTSTYGGLKIGYLKPGEWIPFPAGVPVYCGCDYLFSDFPDEQPSCAGRILCTGPGFTAPDFRNLDGVL